ncbi:hypothetical protein [Novilysobacter spongiicola]|uniref:Uncharacterized protein n=1 Tax=Lysobacter spongiicola DSM 21749 TaxID=1122188 RepID=A0A1T4ND17_9GAMM|nr:hypothetical protein [Lysobacter spongiicola]SJZ76936.1 hypothetical protein SAMN02745674_00836 [Lysobacter spongiicola DSM 21749]
MHALRRHRRRLRTALLVLMVLAMVVSPTLAAVGELHGLEHAAMGASDDGHGHGHPTPDGHHHHDHSDDVADPDPDHATGGHGLMHQAASLTVTMPDEPMAMSGVELCEPLLPELHRLCLPDDAPNLPFRPPIA